MEKYMRVRKIGEGAFGKADLVKRKKDNSQMVIKEINILRMGSKEREEARKEVSVLAQLNHPNIVAYRESFEEHGNLYIVMDYCAGGDLYAKINTQKGVLFSEDQILDWFVQMCLAIKHIHDRKILHRDIKSQNIFLTSKGMIQLGDFGIAKVLNSTVELARTCIGTPYYLSPEICENKPYNNKSDIWSLGCVLYELATLKHAFEAGNMKNLVLKIIRGSYPPVSPKYSYELRNLIAQLFKRAPRDRPSINSVLRKPLLSQRIPKFLTQEQLSSEFSHTVMHGHKLGRALPPPPKEAARPPSAARNRADIGGAAAAAAAVKRYDPSKIYGAPVVGKSRENRASADKKRPGSAGSRPGSAAGSRPGSAAGSRPGSAAGNRPASSQDLKRRRLELVEKEKKRREEIQKKEYERRHKELQDKQKLARINKAREEGWNSLIGSLESDSGGKQEKKESPREQVRVQQPAVPPRPAAGGDYNANAQKERGKYDHYNQYLDKLQQERELRKRQEGVPAQAPAAAYMAAPRPLPGAPNPVSVWRQAQKAPAQTPLYQAHNQRAQYQKEERARLVDDFINRKKEAQLNKQRGQAQLFGPAQNNQYKPPSGANNRVSERQQERPSSAASSRNREEQEYLEKLRQIRQQNYQERKMILGKNSPESEAAERKKKAEALKKQAEDWAKQRKDVIDKKKKELLDKERHMQEVRQNMNKPGAPVVKPRPSVPMTGAVNAIGVAPKVVPSANTPPSKAPAMTGALGAIGAVPKVVELDEDSKSRSEIQKKKDDILRKLNEKGPPKESEEPQESARSKWGGGAKLSLAEQTQEAEPESARPQWGPAPDFNLGKMTLEETGSQMEVTSARDRVIINPESARRQWGGPGETVISALQKVPLAETISSNNSEESVPSTANTNDVPKSVGSTITISRPPIKSGTVVIAKKDASGVKESSDDNKSKDVSTNQTKEDVSPTKDNEESLQKQKEGNQSSNETAEMQESSNQIEADANTDQSQPLFNEQKLKSHTALKEKPPVPSKPAIPEKPLVLPKPVLLTKPDAPMNFETGIPRPGKELGAGSLFEKVELEEEEEPATEQKLKEQEKDQTEVKDIENRAERDELGEEKKKSGLVLGITMGSFDIGHRELLRTCSEPDLSSLFRTMAADTSNVRVRSLDDMSTVKEEDDDDDDENDADADDDNNIDDIEAVYSSMEKAVLEDRGDKEEKDEENNENNNEEEEQEELDEDDEDIADLMSVRATMQSLLLDDSDEESNKKSPVKFNLSSDRESKGDTNDGDIDDTEDDVDLNNLDDAEQGDADDDADDDDDDLDGKDGDDENEADNDGDDDDIDGDDLNVDDDDTNDVQQSVNEDDKDEEDSGMPRSHSVDNENPQTPDEGEDIVSELFQTDESDSEFNDGEEMGDFDLFGRLEESRAELEQELGADKLVKVYKTVQALQEDEDENMEEGARIAQELLGKEKEHLYPKIFQLVMADAAFTDDNLS